MARRSRKASRRHPLATVVLIAIGLVVTGGLIAMLLMLGRVFAVKNFGHKEATSIIVVSYYWHFVDVVWIGLFLVIYVLK